MEQLKKVLDLLPEPVRNYWAVIVGLVVLLILVPVVRRLFRSSRPAPKGSNRDLDEEVAAYPPPRPAGKRTLTAYSLPARIRLIVVAPGSRDGVIKAAEVESLLDRVVPGLGAVAGHDKPRVRVWPAQLSNQGFANTFFQHTKTPDAEGKPSRWVLIAGRPQVGKPAFLLGLALLLDEDNTIGRVDLDPFKWREVLSVKSNG